ncbi:hypothetical protein [Mycolicibacter minnesotensis]|uniref:hypothetical protein n=1 Tax=Mycolicibacter minnesotensis TaxID=1118379 RepID=UPI0009F55BB3|nr:hypothetical protein [Mycolicibacter minnesotensis]BBY34729.1 hypothetical protein MMIN_27900 [Mycolicibacter minnesotensis]
MKYLAHRFATVAAAALTVGGLVTGLTSMTPSLPDVQIRDFDLAAAHIDLNPALDIVENHVRPDYLGGGGADGPHIDLGDLFFGGGDDALGVGSAFSAGELSEVLLNQLAGGNFDPQELPLGVPYTPSLGSVQLPSGGLFPGGTEQAINAAAADAVANFGVFLQGLPDPQQLLSTAVITAQLGFNTALVAAQQAAVDRLFGDSPEINDAVNWIFSVNNTVLAQNEESFNNLFGISFDPRESLLGHFDPQIIEADWAATLGFNTDDFNEIVEAIQSDNLMLLLGSIDWEDLFGGLF